MHLYPSCFGLIVILLVSGCAKEGSNILMPARAAPGGVVHIFMKSPVFSRDKEIQVEIGGRVAMVTKRIDERSISVIVPMIDQGERPLVAKVDNEIIYKDKLIILPTAYTRLVMSMEGSKIQLLSQQKATAGSAPWFPLEEMVLSYDLVTTDGNLAFTGTIRHPIAGRLEVFESDGKLRIYSEKLKQGTFTFKIPNIAGGAVLRFYEVESHVNLETKKGRQARSFIDQVKIGG